MDSRWKTLIVKKRFTDLPPETGLVYKVYPVQSGPNNVLIDHKGTKISEKLQFLTRTCGDYSDNEENYKFEIRDFKGWHLGMLWNSFVEDLSWIDEKFKLDGIVPTKAAYNILYYFLYPTVHPPHPQHENFTFVWKSWCWVSQNINMLKSLTNKEVKNVLEDQL